MIPMRRSLALLIPALLLAAACTQSPTDATRQPTARFDGGNYHGSGNAVGGGVNTMGSGNAVGSGSSGGQISSTTTNTAPADSTGATERGDNYHGSGN
jgi:hypothetical protein